MDNPIRLHWLDPRDPEQPFPPAHLAMRDPNGLLAIGGDLSVDRLIRAYSQGIFPWYNPDEPILWWSPDPRAILPPEKMHITRSLNKAIRRADYAMSMDQSFGDVINQCSGPRTRSRGTWLGSEMREAYMQLHLKGYAHSVEVWRDGSLIGGLYGVALGRVFFGESMFSLQADASKIALHWLCQQMIAWGFGLIDCQVGSPHLSSLGATDVSRERFQNILRESISAPPRTGHWCFDVPLPCARAHMSK